MMNVVPVVPLFVEVLPCGCKGHDRSQTAVKLSARSKD